MFLRLMWVVLSFTMTMGHASLRHFDPLAYPITDLELSALNTVQEEATEKEILEKQAENWRITVEDFQVYRERMQGLAGVWYSHLAPAEVLALTETDPEKRKQYLDIAVDQIRLHAEQTLAYEIDIKKRLIKKYPNEPILKPFDIRPFSPLYQEPLVVKSNSRIVLFAELSNPANWGIVPRLISIINQHPTLYLDVYLTNAENHQIQAWAKQHNLPISLVSQERITLNYDDGSLLKKTLGYQQKPPVLILTNGKDSRLITIDDL